MRGLTILVLLVLFLPTTQPGPSSILVGTEVAPITATIGLEEPKSSPSLMIIEVCPGRPAEYVVLYNPGEDRSVKGTVLSDGEGNVTIIADLVLSRGSALALVSDDAVVQALHPGMRSLVKGGGELSWGGRFILADAGDEVLLISEGGELLDVVVYGSSLYQEDGWNGPSIGTVTKGHAAVRVGQDTDTSEDWSVEPPGRSDLSMMSFEALVEPFSSPENAAERLLRELRLASHSVNCSVYEIADPAIVTALAGCSRRGIDVNVLVEGQPVGGLSNGSLKAIATLQASGAEVRALHSSDGYKRYDYLHSKYMVLDARRVVVMSENWGAGLNKNRGWGVCIDGVGIAGHFDRLFEEDFRGELDILVPSVVGPVLAPVEAEAGGLEDLVRYRCAVSTIISPDHSGAALHDLISGAKQRILVEQMSVDRSWLTGPSLVGDLVAAAARGVSVRLLLDTSWGGGDNGEVARTLNDLATRNGLDLEARLISEYHGLSVMHNKGIIVDDRTVISSINWGNSAIRENREVGVIIDSAAVAEHFSALFWQDWSVDPIPPRAVLPWTFLHLRLGEPAFLDGRGSMDNAGILEFEWDVDGDGGPENTSSCWAVALPEGNNTIVLTVRDRGNNTATATCWVEVVPANEATNVPVLPFVIAALIFSGAVVALKKIIGGKSH